MLRLSLFQRAWPMHEPFRIATGVQSEQSTVQVILTDAVGRRGRGEGCGITQAGETAESMMRQIEAVRGDIESGVTRDDLLQLLPRGGARFALDSALWDIEAKRTGVSPFMAAGVERNAIVTAYTIGIRDPAGYETAARARCDQAVLKVKVDAADPLAAVAAVRRGAPEAALIVDPNQSWSVPQTSALAPELHAMGVVLLEQPVAVGDERGLETYGGEVPLAADELVEDEGDLARAVGRFSVINIKLDKAGGLTGALRLADAARAMGFDLMVGCMAGSSLSMAPSMVLAQRCRFVDLDGPLLQSEDWPGGLVYRSGIVSPPAPSFWG